MNLLVEQRASGLRNKIWKVRPGRQPITLGQSRKAQLRSQVNSLAGLHGVFEFRDGKWWYTQLAPTRFESHDGLKKDATLCVDQPLTLRIPEGEIRLTPITERPVLFSGTPIIEGSSQARWIVSYRNGHFVDSKILSLDEKLVVFDGNSDVEVQLQSTPQWQTKAVGDLQIRHRIVQNPDVTPLSKPNRDELIEKGQGKYIMSVLGFIGLLGLLMIWGANSQPDQQIANPVEYREVTTVVKKEKKTDAVSKAMANALPPQSQSTSAPKTVGAVISKIKSAGLSKLIAKVSAQAKKSANVVITNKGEKAGSLTPTGRAIAAIGTIGKKSDWTGSTGGVGGVATAGKGGGGTGKGLGAISAGGTGGSGVGAIEEESEIVGGLDRELIARVIQENIGQILYCYERQLSATPDLFGKVAVKFTIAGDGSVETQRVGETSLRNANVESCMLQKISRWKFPKPNGGTKVVVSYPFLFKSTN